MVALASGPAEVNLDGIYSGLGWSFTVGPIIRTDTMAAIGLTAVQMDIRYGRNQFATRGARLDTTGTADGLITIFGGSLNNFTVTLPDVFTENMIYGQAWYDLWVKPSGSDWLPLYFGMVEVLPHITDVVYT